MVGRHKSSGSRPKLIPRPKHGATVLRNVGLFAGYNESSVLEQDDAFDLAEQLASHKRDDDASGAGEDAIPNDGDDQAREGAVRSPTGRLALRSSRNGDRLRLQAAARSISTTRTMFCGGFATWPPGAASQSASTSGYSCSPRRQTGGCGLSPATWPRLWVDRDAA